MKTPDDTAKIASQIQVFLQQKNITVARCDALELAARLKGLRDLHEDQATPQTTETAVGLSCPFVPVYGPDLSFFFEVLAMQLKSSISITRSIGIAKSVLPKSAQCIATRLIEHIENGASLASALNKIGLPDFLSATIDAADRSGSYHRGFEIVIELMRRNPERFPRFDMNLAAA